MNIKVKNCILSFVRDIQNIPLTWKDGYYNSSKAWVDGGDFKTSYQFEYDSSQTYQYEISAEEGVVFTLIGFSAYTEGTLPTPCTYRATNKTSGTVISSSYTGSSNCFGWAIMVSNSADLDKIKVVRTKKTVSADS